jgi:hypothetical protein
MPTPLRRGGPTLLHMIDKLRQTTTALALVGAAALGGSAIAGAASGTTGSTGSTGASGAQERPAREALSGETAAKVKAAALEEVPGATVLRTEAGGPYATSYHAHIRTSGGTAQVVLVNSQFEATAVQADRGRGGRGGRGHHGGPGGPRGAALSSETAAKVKAAALEEVPGATVLRTEQGGPYATKYHAHIRTSGGTEQVVLVDDQFEATAVQADRGPGGRGRGPQQP